MRMAASAAPLPIADEAPAAADVCGYAAALPCGRGGCGWGPLLPLVVAELWAQKEGTAAEEGAVTLEVQCKDARIRMQG